MAKATSKRKLRPAMSPEARENQMIALAYDQAERDLLEGKASSQVVTHFLKLGTMKERLEREKLEEENKLLRAKTENIELQKNIEKLYTEAIDAMKLYSGNGSVEYDEDVY